MPTAFIYLLKLSVSLAIVFLFYQLVLRKLTFYNWNRWYLLCYTALSFIIPFIDITPALHNNELTDSTMVQWVPLLYNKSTSGTLLSVWNILSLLIVAGMLVMLIRFLIQLISFRQMRKKAILISGDDINLYQVNESIIPFSFGNAVFINRHLHTAEELEEIIRHEFVHVKQRHSIDIIFSEILCLLNWYNPFAWMIRAAIRQNLEFVADNQVLENGINKKQYQYLLLKVIGNDQFSIAQKFNFSSLKKRIAMMNKNKSAKMHLLRFLFLLPVLAVILISFRKELRDTLTGKQKQLPPIPVNASDTVPEVTKPNSKGYIINVKDKKGECLLVIKDKTGKEVKRLLLTEWNTNAEKFEASYGEIPPPPPPAAPPAPGKVDYPAPLQPPAASTAPGAFDYPAPPQPPAAPTPVELPANVQKMSISNNKAIVSLKKNGQKEEYDLNIQEQKEKFEKKYGSILPPPPPPAKDNEAPAVNMEFKRKIENTDASVHGSGTPYGISGSNVKGIPDNVLYILDGIEIKKSEMDKLEPEKIESINVLKGNSAVTLYGEKGSNGVIIIKTKTNEKAKPIKQTPYLFPVVKSDGC